MNIICPQCGFSRPFPPDRAPAHSVIATCPQCSCRFRFHPQDGSSEQLSPVRNEAAPAASDLPPGAIIPGMGDDGEGGAPCRREDPREEIPPFRPRDRQEEPKPHYNTLSTIVRVLEEKGYIGYRPYGNTYQYYALVSEDEYRNKTLKNVVSRYFGDSYTRVVSSLIDRDELSVEELEELLQQIKNRKNK